MQDLKIIYELKLRRNWQSLNNRDLYENITGKSINITENFDIVNMVGDWLLPFTDVCSPLLCDTAISYEIHFHALCIWILTDSRIYTIRASTCATSILSWQTKEITSSIVYGTWVGCWNIINYIKSITVIIELNILELSQKQIKWKCCVWIKPTHFEYKNYYRKFTGNIIKQEGSHIRDLNQFVYVNQEVLRKVFSLFLLKFINNDKIIGNTDENH